MDSVPPGAVDHVEPTGATEPKKEKGVSKATAQKLLAKYKALQVSSLISNNITEWVWIAKEAVWGNQERERIIENEYFRF